MKLSSITPCWVTEIPKEKEEGVMYISLEYKTAVHLCACGCGKESVTPLKEGEWTLIEQKGLVTLRPSIGNFSGEKPHHAHYFITNNQIQWA